MRCDSIYKRMKVFLVTFTSFCGLATTVMAWQIDGYHSGMTFDEVTLKLKAAGIDDLVSSPLVGHRAVTILQSRHQKNGSHFTFCEDRLFEISKDFDGGLLEFAQEVGIESSKRGLAATEVLKNGNLAANVISKWYDKEEYFEMILESELKSDLTQQLSYAKSYGDNSIKNDCYKTDKK